MNTFGSRYRTTIFGTSHGPFVGCTIEALRAGTPIDPRLGQVHLDRRRPGQSLVTSQRKEEDRVEFAEGRRAGTATRAPIEGILGSYPLRAKSSPESARFPRPGVGR